MHDHLATVSILKRGRVFLYTCTLILMESVLLQIRETAITTAVEGTDP